MFAVIGECKSLVLVSMFDETLQQEFLAGLGIYVACILLLRERFAGEEKILTDLNCVQTFDFFDCQDETDYLRSYHSTWHVVAGIASHFLWRTIPRRDHDRAL
jgi:hypothetical protein